MDKELVVLQSIRDRLVALLDIISEDSVTSSTTATATTTKRIADSGRPPAGDSRRRLGSTITLENNISSAAAAAAPPPAPTFVKKRKLVSLKADEDQSQQTRIAKKSRKTTKLLKGALRTHMLLVKEIGKPVQAADLSRWQIWFFSHNMTPASFQTASRVRTDDHMYDWFTAFGMILEGGLTNINQGKQHDEENNKDDDTDDKREEEDSDEDQRTSRKRAKGKQKMK
ncbi:hypothetical protein BGZ65_001892 [Modicella reniformis]|uniref:Uncharacterized protein n=1 Tax=Modicella reniformis TaxID=1440133 RepID=A0A9P6MIR0_9FUNG|nr:hypothetical protein BGZ65_001892 [Modicella reniformis]